MSEELKPCPFCGGEAEHYSRLNTGATADWCGEVSHWASCTGDCGAGTCMHETEASAWVAWNTRASTTALQAELAEARARNAVLEGALLETREMLELCRQALEADCASLIDDAHHVLVKHEHLFKRQALAGKETP
jgi:Lar family restriction alleviation protein